MAPNVEAPWGVGSFWFLCYSAGLLDRLLHSRDTGIPIDCFKHNRRNLRCKHGQCTFYTSTQAHILVYTNKLMRTTTTTTTSAAAATTTSYHYLIIFFRWFACGQRDPATVSSNSSNTVNDLINAHSQINAAYPPPPPSPAVTFCIKRPCLINAPRENCSIQNTRNWRKRAKSINLLILLLDSLLQRLIKTWKQVALIKAPSWL